MHRDVTSGAVLLLVAVLYFVGARGLPAGQGEPGPAFFPFVLAGALALSAIVIMARGVRAGGPGPDAHAPRSRTPSQLWKPGLAVALTALYVALFQAAGFALSTWLYTLSVTLLFRSDRRVLLVAVPTLSTLFIYALFQVGLGVRLP